MRAIGGGGRREGRKGEQTRWWWPLLISWPGDTPLRRGGGEPSLASREGPLRQPSDAVINLRDSQDL